MKRLPASLLLLGFLLATVVLYHTALQARFNFDDFHAVTGNATEGLFNSLGEALTINASRPLFYLTLAFNYRLHGLTPWPYHLTNLLLHGLAGFLVFLLARDLLAGLGPCREAPGDFPAWTAALLFWAHPLNTETVTYVTSRSGLLATLGTVGAVLAFRRAGRAASRGLALGWGGVAFLAFLLGLASKEEAAIGPLLLLLTEWCCPVAGPGDRAGARWTRYAALVPFFAVPAAALGWRLAHGGLGAEGGWPRSLVQQVFSGPQTLWRYLRLWVFPVGLNVDHDVRTVSRAGDPRFWVAALAGVVLVGAVVWGWRRTRLPALALGWFGVGLLPSTAYPLADLVAEHRAYLAGIGLALGAAGGLAALLARWPAGAADLRRRWVPVGLLVLGAALLTVQRNQVWLSDEALWRDAIAKSPRKGRPYNNLAQNLESQNRFQEALRLYRKAITVDPSYYQSYNNLGFLYYRQGNLTAAREMYRKTLELKPELGKTLYNLGQIAQDQGRLEEAIDWYGRALAGNARFLPARTNLAMCRVEQGRYLEAQRLLKEGLQYVPDDPDLHFNLATVYLKRKEWRPAISELETVLRLQPDDVEAYRSLGAVYLFELGNREEGLRYFQRSFQLDPDSPRTREIQRSLGLR